MHQQQVTVLGVLAECVPGTKHEGTSKSCGQWNYKISFSLGQNKICFNPYAAFYVICLSMNYSKASYAQIPVLIIPREAYTGSRIILSILQMQREAT